jgi:lipopolysaccharide export system permease protein
MTIFSRYVFRQTGSALLLILLSLTGIVWISLALRELNVVTSMGQSALTLIKMTTLGLPNFLAVIAPFALLITVIHTLNRLNSDSEIIVLTASGATAWTVTRPVVALAVVVALFVSFVNHFAMPWSLQLLREIIVDVRTDLLTQVIQPGRFSSPEKGLTFHIRDRALNGELSGLVMHDARDPEQIQSYLAERGFIVEQPGGSYLVMSSGHILRSAQGKDTQIIAFDKYAVDLDGFEQKNAEAPDLKPRERYFSELINPETTSKSFKDQPNRFITELHERFASALYPIAFALIAVAVVGQAQSTRQNRNLRMGVCFAGGVALRVTGLALNNLVTINAALFPLLYIVPLAAIAGSLVMIVRGARPSRSNMLDRVADAASAAYGRLRSLLPTRLKPAFRS